MLGLDLLSIHSGVMIPHVFFQRGIVPVFLATIAHDAAQMVLFMLKTVISDYAYLFGVEQMVRLQV